jgi:predicted AlkP superfamily pyrophosphatase or phosphodiesterase
VGPRKKLVLAVIDSLKPEMLDRAIAQGRAPALAELVKRGTYVRECVSTFPSVTPVAASSIATGLQPHEHHVPAMNWYHRGEARYVEYGSSFEASRVHGIVRSLGDTIYNLNMAHLTRERPTVFEALDDAGLRTACTTYLIYRGRHRHEMAQEGIYARIGRLAFRHGVWGPTELFYADLFASRKTGCRSVLGLPGQRDQHTACVGAHLVENDLCDFMLFSLPDTDTFSHKNGPYAQPVAIASADRALERLFHVAGGVDAFLDEWGVIVMSDHSQTPVDDSVNLADVLEGWNVARPGAAEGPGAELAVCPSQRSAMVYVLDPERRDEIAPKVARDLQGVDGVDLVARRENGEAVVWGRHGELRFAPGGEVEDELGGRWQLEGDRDALALADGDGRAQSRTYPLALPRLWWALENPAAGDVLVSAEPGFEFVDWGGVHHVGGGSHGSLHRGDSLGVLIHCGVLGAGAAPGAWTLADATPMVWRHFGVDPG